MRNPPPGATPEAIGRQTRELVAGALAASGYRPPDTRFLARIESFAASLALWGRRSNLTATPDDPAELAFHIIDSLMPLLLAASPDSATLRDRFVAETTVLDLGSGAGFPGLLLASASAARFVLLESRRKRAHFLEATAALMELTNVTIDASHRGPADLSPRFDLVVGRAFARPALFYRSAAAALRTDGHALLYATVEQPLDRDDAVAAGLGEPLIVSYEVPRAGRQPVARLLALWRKIR